MNDESAIDDPVPASGLHDAASAVAPSGPAKVPLRMAGDDRFAAVASSPLSFAQNDNGPAPEARSETSPTGRTGRIGRLSAPFAFALLLSCVWVAVVGFGNVFFSSVVQQILSAGGPVAIFSAMQFYRSSNETMKARVRALNQERADAETCDRLARLAAKARSDLTTVEGAADRAIDRSFALSKAVAAEVEKLEGACRESEGLLAGLIQSAVEAELRAVSSHKQLQDAAALEAGKLQSLVGDVLTAFQASGRDAIAELKATLDSARGEVESLFVRQSADVNRSLDTRIKQLTETLATREDEYRSRLETLSVKVAENYKTATQIALDAIVQASEGFSEQAARGDKALAAVVERSAENLRSALRAHATTMEGAVSTVGGEIERSRKSVLDAFAKIEPSLSKAGAELLAGLSNAAAANKTQIEESVAAFLTSLEDSHIGHQDRLESAMGELIGRVASSSGRLGVLFDVQSADFLSKLDGRVEALKEELEERKRVIQEFLSTTRATLSDDVLAPLQALEQGVQNQAATLNSTLSVRLAEIDAMLSGLGDQLLFELGAAISKLKGELPAQTEAFVREIANAGSLVGGKAGEMAQALELSSSVFLEVLERKATQLDQAIVEGGAALVAKFEQSAVRLSEVISETTRTLDTDFKRNSADAIAALAVQADHVEAGFNKSAQSAIDQMGSQIDFLMEALANSISRLDQLIRNDGGQLTAGLDERADRASVEFQAAIDRINALFEGRADDWAARVSESSNVLARDVDAALDSFDGRVEHKLREIFESIARLTVRLQNGLDLKAGILNEMLGRRATELSKIIGTMIDGYANPDGLAK